MSPTDLDRRAFLRAGSGLIAAAAFGGCASSRESGPDTTAAPTAPRSPTTSVVPGTTAAPSTSAPVPAPLGSTRLVPMRPVRLADTRRSDGWTTVDPGRIRVPIAGRGQVPADASAAVVRVTATDDAAAGGVTVVPAGAAGDDLPDVGPAGSQTCFVLLGDGAADVRYGPETAHVTVDVLGWFDSVAAATSSGRIVGVDPVRITDTAASAQPFAPAETRRVTPDGACPPDALAVLVRVTATSDAAGGGWAVHAPGTPEEPPVLTADPDRLHSVSTLVPLADGGFEVTSQAGGHVSIDVTAYVTGEGSPVAVDGFYVPTIPRRLLDTRGIGQPIPDGSSREFPVGPDPVGAVSLNVSVVAASGEPTASAWGAGSSPPSSAGPGTTGVASYQAVVPAGRRGVAVGTSGGDAHVVADLYGWFVGTRSSENVPVLGSQPYGIQGVDMESQADEWFDYGTSTDGRPLRAFRCGSGPRVGLLSTGLHGDEHTGTSVLADLVTHGGVAGWTLWLVPIANPDARAANTRFVHDVDMNRDFPVDWREQPRLTGSGCVTTRTGPVPHSLAESRLLAAAMIDGPFRTSTISISHHDNYNWVAPQSGSPAVLRELATDYADATGLRRPGEGGSTVPTSPRSTHVDGGFETFAHSLGMASFLVENKAGYVGGSWCAGSFGLQPSLDDVLVHHDALVGLLNDGRLPAD